jgi:glyoxylase-like metal-dependent hydrolase (beta-lactamase superfamily II)
MQIHQISGYIAKLYLVEYPHGLLLLDSGCRCDVPVVKEFIEVNLKRPFSDLKLVCVSHAHPDHSGGASFYQNAGIPIAGKDEVNDWYKGIEGFFAYIIDIFLTYYVAKRVRKEKVYQNVLFPRKLNFDYQLKKEEPLPLFEDWLALSTPGHTSTDLSFYHRESAQAYVADNLIATSRGLIPPYPIFDPEAYQRSLSRYLDLKIEKFLMAHYGSHKLEPQEIQKVKERASKRPRIHRTVLPKILKKAFLKRLKLS